MVQGGVHRFTTQTSRKVRYEWPARKVPPSITSTTIHSFRLSSAIECLAFHRLLHYRLPSRLLARFYPILILILSF